MKKTFKRILASLMVAVMVLTVAPLSGFAGLDLQGIFSVSASAAEYSGTCGDNLTWTFDEETGELVISGEGQMKIDDSWSYPWKSYSQEIKSVVISDGVTTIANNAFSMYPKLTNVAIGEGVRSIGAFAFEYCGNLKSVTGCNSLRYIGQLAFRDCSSLTSINLGRVTRIGRNAFESCTSLADVTLSDSIRNISAQAFFNCTSLTNITIPDSVTSIGDGAFDYCTSLTEIRIPDRVVVIGSGAFGNTGYYDNVENWENDVLYIGKHLIKAKHEISGNCTIKDGTTDIAKEAFSGCSYLKSATIPGSVKYIGEEAFVDCDFESLEIPDGVETIGEAAFAMFNLTSISIPASVTEIGAEAFAYCINVNKITVDPENTKYFADENNVLFNKDKTELILYPAKNTATEYVIPDTVSVIGPYAFLGASKLENVTIPHSVKHIGEAAFEGAGLTSVFIPNSVQTIYRYAFSGCPNLTEAVFEEGTVLIDYSGMNIFGGCANLKKVKIPNSITYINEEAFRGCDSLESVEIGNGVELINWGAFQYCDNLTDVYYYGIEEDWNKIDFSEYNECLLNANIHFLGEQGFTYELDENDDAIITGYNGEVPSELVIPSTIDGYTVVAIDDYAFTQCENITDVTIPDTVKSIGDYAFLECNSLANISIPASVVELGLAPFLNSSLESITVDSDNPMFLSDEYGVLYNKNKTQLIEYPCASPVKTYKVPDTVTSLGYSAFASAFYLEEVILSDFITELGYSAFNGCTSLRKIKLPDNLKQIEGMAFYDCRSLESIIIPDGVEYIEYGAFYHCQSLESAVIGDGVEYIAINAFDDCSSLKTLTLGNKLRTIDTEAFYICNNITDIYYRGIEADWNKIDILDGNDSLFNANIHFLGGQGFTYELDENNDAIITGYNGEVPSELVIPSAIDGYTVVAIGEKAFKNCDSFTSVAIPDSVKTIGKFAFNACLSLASVTIGKGLESFSDVTPFETCYSLESITVDPENISFSSDEYGVLFNNDKTELVRYPIGNTRPDYTIPVGVKKIRFAAFVSCKSIINVIVPEGVEIIDYAAFAFCNNLAKVELPDSIARIGEYAFAECQVLDNVTLGSNVEYIGDYAFPLCDELTQAIIPDSVTYIGNGAYGLCKNLTTVKIGDGVKSIGEVAFAECYSLTDLTIGNNVETIGLAAFGACVELKKVTIPDSVINIGDSAFETCLSLETVNMGNGVEYISKLAFKKCDSLTDVYYYGTEEEWNEIEIEEGNECLLNATIHFLGEHQFTHFTIPSTCKVQGMEYDLCSHCGETFNVKVLPLADHTWGKWEVVREATTALEGLKQRKCSVCGTTEDEIIPKLKVLVDDESGIIIEYEDEYGEGVEIVVEETYDGDSFQLIDLNYGSNQTKIFDISTVKDGEKVQPEGKVKVRIPLPEGFGTKNIFVCYVDSINGTVKTISAKVVNGYVEFEAEHFSYYAVVEKLGKVNSVSINDVSMNYKDSATITPTINVDKDVKYTVSYSSSNDSVATVDANGNVTTRGTGNATITVTVTDEYGNTVTDTSNVNVTYKWWQWIIVIVLFGWIWY